MGHGYHRKLNFSDRLPKLFKDNLALGRRLGSVTMCGENREGFILAAAGMSAAWRARRKNAQIFVLRFRSGEAKISFEMALSGHYQGKICYREIDFVEVLSHPVSERRIRELAGLLLIKRGNMGSSRHASPSQRTIVAVSLVRFPIVVQSSFPREVVVVPSSPGATPSQFAGSSLVNLGPCFVAGGAWSSPGVSIQRENPSLINETWTLSHSPSFEAYTPGWVITRDSLLSEDTTTKDWSWCAHPLAKIGSIVVQLSVGMAGDLFTPRPRLLPLSLLSSIGLAGCVNFMLSRTSLWPARKPL
ncbi:unnamed protein product [Lactuca saligna]|uniref:Uncharacterized protein n=1 Tax=Lactuca saligna TaxID=75948 RepID=A0AA36E1L5_LACSI|nr:unnamed protein product [Lactuca saligna]